GLPIRPITTTTCGTTPTSDTGTRGSSSRTPRPRTGRGIRWPRRTTGTASSIISPISTWTIRPYAARFSRPCSSGWTGGLTDSAAMPSPISSSATAPTARACPRPTRSSARSGARSTIATRAVSSSPRRTNGRPRCVPTSATATSSTWPSTFPLMPRMFLAIRHADRRPITDIFRHTPDLPSACQWCLFLRNHDELTLETVSEEERRRLYHAYVPDPRMRLNVGIRRRLAPLLDNDRRKTELLTSLLFTLPGSPILYYGDEIGMGDNIYLGDRNGVRTPMQWTGDRNAGFSRADAARLYLPMIVDPVYGYQSINVEAQLRTPSSMLNWMKRLIAARKKTRVFGRGTLRFLRPANESILAHVREHEGETILAVHNLSGAAQPAQLAPREWAHHTPIELLGETRFPGVRERPYFVSLAPYGYYWFRLEPPAQSVTTYGIEGNPL